jgi:hypothetical protein
VDIKCESACAFVGVHWGEGRGFGHQKLIDHNSTIQKHLIKGVGTEPSRFFTDSSGNNQVVPQFEPCPLHVG